MAYLNSITKIIKQIQDSDEKTRDRYNYHRGLSLHMIKKLMGADQSQWVYINNALKSGVDKGKLIKTGGKYRVAVTKKKSRKSRKCKYGRDRSTGKCRKKSAKRKVSRKRRSVKRKVSRKRRSVKRKVSRKRRSAKRKVSRKRRSVKRKTSRKRRSTKRKGKKLKFRMITKSEKDQIKEEKLFCPICMVDLEDAKNEDIVGCMGASEIPGWTCCSKTKKTGCKNNYFHKKCIETWVKTQESQHIPPSCPTCREKKVTEKPPNTSYARLAAGLTGALLLLNADVLAGVAGNLYRGGQIRRCHDPTVNSLDIYDGIRLPKCRNECSYIKKDWNNIPHTFELTSPPYECPLWMADSWENWHANMTPEEWRESQGIAKDRDDGGESIRAGYDTKTMSYFGRDAVGSEPGVSGKHNFRMSKKKSRKRRSVKRKTSRKRRSVKRKVSRKRKSTKKKASRKRRSAKNKFRVKPGKPGALVEKRQKQRRRVVKKRPKKPFFEEKWGLVLISSYNNRHPPEYHCKRMFKSRDELAYVHEKKRKQWYKVSEYSKNPNKELAQKLYAELHDIDDGMVIGHPRIVKSQYFNTKEECRHAYNLKKRFRMPKKSDPPGRGGPYDPRYIAHRLRKEKEKEKDRERRKRKLLEILRDNFGELPPDLQQKLLEYLGKAQYWGSALYPERD